MLGEDRAALEIRATDNIEAYDLFLLGRHHEQARNESGFEKAIEHYSEAITLDPDYAQAWAGLARAWLLLADYGSAPVAQAHAEARRAVERAAAIAPDLPDMLSAQALLFNYTGEISRQMETLERLVEIAPDHVEGLSALANRLETDPQRGERLARRAWELDPLSELTRLRLVAAIAVNGRREEALALAREMLESDPDNPGLYEVMANINRISGHLDEAVAAYAATHRLRPGDVFPAWQIVGTSLAMDDPDAARRWLDIARERGADSLWAEAATLVLNLYEGNHETVLSDYAGVASGAIVPWTVTSNMVATSLVATGRIEEARGVLRLAVEKSGADNGPVLNNETADALLMLASLLSESDEREELLGRVRAYAQALKERRPHFFEGWWIGAGIAAVEGDRNAMLADLERAVDTGLRGARWRDLSTIFSAWRDDPEYRAFVLRLEALSAELRDRTAALDLGLEDEV